MSLENIKVSYELGMNENEREQLDKILKTIPITIQGSPDLELRVREKNEKTFFFKTNKVIHISPVQGEIESVWYSNPIFDDTVRALFSGKEKARILYGELRKEIEIWYSQQF